MDDASIAVTHTIERIGGNGGAVLLDLAPAISDGATDGQTVILQGTHETNTVTIADNVNTQLAGGVSMELGDNDILALMWDSTIRLD